MTAKWCLALLLLFPLFHLPLFAHGGIDYKTISLAAGCRIHTAEGVYVTEFTGVYCIFLPDGRYVSANAERLSMFNSDRAEVWKLPGHYHHQINFTFDKKAILALSSKFEMVNGKRVRIDLMQRIDLNGKITGEVTSRQAFDKLNIKRVQTPFGWDVGAQEKADYEISHFNSLHEIPPLKTKSKFPGMRAGNYIANSTMSGAIIIDSEFKSVISKIEFKSANDQSTHDVQVMPDGKILFLNNDRIRDFKNTGPRSSVEYLDPLTGQSTYAFMASPPEMFYTPFSGGVQQVTPDVVFISHVTNAFFFLNTKTRKVIGSGVLKNELGVPHMLTVQQIRAEDLREFLKKWQ